jgi:uncharacterized protein DUF222
VTAAVCEPVAAISECLDSVRGMLSGLDDKGITQALREIEGLSRRTHAMMLDLVAEIDSRGIAGRVGFGTTQRLVAELLHLSAGEVRARVEQASMVGARRALTGETLSPRLPATAAALAAGEIGPGQLRVITEAIGALPASIPQPARDRADAELANYARDFDPRRLRIIAHRLLACLDPDGPPPDDEATAAPPVRGELWLRDRRDGRLGLEGWLDPEHGSLLRARIDQLATRRTGSDGMPHTHTVPQRHADALIELSERARATEEFPTTAGEPPHVTVTIHWDALRTGVGAATLDYGQLINAVRGASREPGSDSSRCTPSTHGISELLIVSEETMSLKMEMPGRGMTGTYTKRSPRCTAAVCQMSYASSARASSYSWSASSA